MIHCKEIRDLKEDVRLGSFKSGKKNTVAWTLCDVSFEVIV